MYYNYHRTLEIHLCYVPLPRKLFYLSLLFFDKFNFYALLVYFLYCQPLRKHDFQIIYYKSQQADYS